MIEIDVTHLANDPDLWCYSGSAAEHGPMAAKFTWSQACEQGKEHPLLTTPKMIQEAKTYFQSFGAWTPEEIAEWSDEDVNGMAVQEAASALRERAHFDSLKEWEKACREGQCLGQVYRGDKGKWYMMLSE